YVPTSLEREDAAGGNPNNVTTAKTTPQNRTRLCAADHPIGLDIERRQPYHSPWSTVQPRSVHVEVSYGLPGEQLLAALPPFPDTRPQRVGAARERQSVDRATDGGRSRLELHLVPGVDDKDRRRRPFRDTEVDPASPLGICLE